MSKANRTIIHLVRLEPKKLGSFEEYIIALSRGLDKRGFRSIIIFTDPVPVELNQAYRGCEVLHLSREKLGGLFFYYQLFIIFRKYKPDVVHISFYAFFSILTFLIYVFGVPNIIFSDRVSGALKPKKGLKKFIALMRNKFLCIFIKKIICVSDYVRRRDETLPGIDRSKFICILNGVNLGRFSKNSTDSLILRRQMGIRESDFVVSNISNLIKVKGIDNIVEAANILNQKYEDIIFLIIGEGDQRKEFQRLAEKFGLKDKVRFLGLRNDSEKILSITDVFVYPSVWQEACAFGIVEALACGIPVIATDVGGTPELIRNGITGILIKPHDYSALAENIERLYHDRKTLSDMSKLAQEDAAQRFRLSRVVNQTIDIYETCLEKR